MNRAGVLRITKESLAKAAVLTTAAAALVIFFTNTSPSVRGAELQMSLQAAGPGQTQAGELILTSQSASISGIQVDLAFDPDLVVVDAELTPSIAAQQKELTQVELQRGIIRLLILGTNSTPLKDGAVARIRLKPLSAVQQSHLVRAGNLIATSPEGQEVHVVLIDPAREASTQKRR